MRRKTLSIIVLLLMAAGVGAYYAYPILNPVHVDATKVEKGNLYLTIKASGQVVPKELVPVTAPAPAKVVSIAVSLGQVVKKGDVLMDIEIVSTGQGLGPSAPPTQRPVQPGQASPTSIPPASPSPPPPATPTPAPKPQGTQPPSPVPQQPQSQPSPVPTPSPPVLPREGPHPSPRPSPQPSPSNTSPTPSPSPPSSPPPGPAPAPVGTYTIEPGDTLSAIAARNGTTVDEIVRANGISNPDLIYPGQQLAIPEGQRRQGGFLGIPPVDVARVVTTITSPIDGQVMKLEVRTDQLVAPPTPLVVLADMTSLYLEVIVDQEDLPALSAGQAAQTVLDALSKETAKGKVEEINLMPVTSPLGISGYPVKVKMETPPNGVRLGMTGQTEIVTRQLTGILFVPRRAVLEQRGEAYVFVVEENRVQKTLVTVGQKTRDYYEIAAGLVEGQSITVTKLDELDDGKRVAVDRVLGPK